LYAKELSENSSMRTVIRAAIQGGMPSLAECGGFMYLHETMEDAQGQRYPMAGILPGNISNQRKLVRFGYVELQEKQEHFLGGSIKGHEFHYYDSSCNGEDALAVKPTSGRSWECCHITENHWWGFPHLYYPSNPDFVKHFAEQMQGYFLDTNGGNDYHKSV
jgi:cobyrinic acid a,c-diamide synthase